MDDCLKENWDIVEDIVKELLLKEELECEEVEEIFKKHGKGKITENSGNKKEEESKTYEEQTTKESQSENA